MRKVVTIPPSRPVDESSVRGRRAETMIPPITPEARRYAIRELARRAGVSRDFFEKWTIEVTEERTTISFGPEIHATVHFPNRSRDWLEKIVRGTIPVARAEWPKWTEGRIPPPDLVLPFCQPEPGSGGPLYRTTSIGELTCRHDLLSSILFTLSRVEETLCDALDEHGRFPASASVAAFHDFLERPIVDEHGLAFERAISGLIPQWQPQKGALRIKLTHDIDDIGVPFRPRTSAAHILKRHKPFAALRDLLSTATSLEPSELAQVRKLAVISSSKRRRSSFYWKASPAGPFDSGYDPKQARVQRVIGFLKEGGHDLGIHPGYDTFGNRAKLAAEVNCLREALCVNYLGGRQHYLRWNPETWRDWESCGLHYDSSVGFADRFGFRCGTALPYRPWCFAENRELNLIEVPLILMDCTPVKYMKLSRTEGLARVGALIHCLERTGGVFTLLWHNTPLLDPDYEGWYESILNMLSEAHLYEVPLAAGELW